MLHGELRATKAPKDRVHLSVFSMTSLPWSVSHGQNNALMSRPFAVPIPRALIFIKRPGHSRNPVLLDVVLQHLIPAWSILAALALCLHIVHLHWFFSKFFSKPTHFHSQKMFSLALFLSQHYQHLNSWCSNLLFFGVPLTVLSIFYNPL